MRTMGEAGRGGLWELCAHLAAFLYSRIIQIEEVWSQKKKGKEKRERENSKPPIRLVKKKGKARQ